MTVSRKQTSTLRVTDMIRRRKLVALSLAILLGALTYFLLDALGARDALLSSIVGTVSLTILILRSPDGNIAAWINKLSKIDIVWIVGLTALASFVLPVGDVLTRIVRVWCFAAFFATGICSSQYVKNALRGSKSSD